MKLKYIIVFFIISIVSLSKEVIFEFNISQGEIEYYKENEIKKIVKFSDYKKKLNLSKGEYNFLFKGEEVPPIIKKIDIKTKEKIKIDFDRNNIIKILGTTKCENMNVGGVKLTFYDKNGIGYSVESDYLGRFSCTLPKGTYKLEIDKTGYKNENIEKILHKFDDGIKQKKLDIELEKISSVIAGKVMDKQGNSLEKVKIYVKNNGQNKELYTDENGDFSIQVNSGIVSIIATKGGYYQKGSVLNIAEDTKIENLEIRLDEARYTVTGVVSNGIKPIKNLQIDLRDEEFNRLYSYISDENGFFEFYRVKSIDKIFITISKNGKLLYKSDELQLNKDIRNYNIYLEDK